MTVDHELRQNTKNMIKAKGGGCYLLPRRQWSKPTSRPASGRDTETGMHTTGAVETEFGRRFHAVRKTEFSRRSAGLNNAESIMRSLGVDKTESIRLSPSGRDTESIMRSPVGQKSLSDPSGSVKKSTSIRFSAVPEVQEVSGVSDSKSPRRSIMRSSSGGDTESIMRSPAFDTELSRRSNMRSPGGPKSLSDSSGSDKSASKQDIEGSSEQHPLAKISEKDEDVADELNALSESDDHDIDVVHQFQQSLTLTLVNKSPHRDLERLSNAVIQELLKQQSEIPNSESSALSKDMSKEAEEDLQLCIQGIESVGTHHKLPREQALSFFRLAAKVLEGTAYERQITAMSPTHTHTPSPSVSSSPPTMVRTTSSDGLTAPEPFRTYAPISTLGSTKLAVKVATPTSFSPAAVGATLTPSSPPAFPAATSSPPATVEATPAPSSPPAADEGAKTTEVIDDDSNCWSSDDDSDDSSS